MAIDYDKMNERIQLVSLRLAELNKPAIARDSEMALALATLANLAVDLLTCVQDLDERLQGNVVVNTSGPVGTTRTARAPSAYKAQHPNEVTYEHVGDCPIGGPHHVPKVKNRLFRWCSRCGAEGKELES